MMRSLPSSFAPIFLLSLACGGGPGDEGAGASSAAQPQAGAPKSSQSAQAQVSEASQSGCDAVERGLSRLLRGPITSSQSGAVCTVNGDGPPRRPGSLREPLTRALSGWEDAGRLAADGEDGTQFALRKGDSLCVIGV